MTSKEAFTIVRKFENCAKRSKFINIHIVGWSCRTANLVVTISGNTKPVQDLKAMVNDICPYVSCFGNKHDSFKEDEERGAKEWGIRIQLNEK